MLGFNGGLLGVRKVTTTAEASGLWMPNEQSVARRAGIWPLVGGVDINAITYSQSSVVLSSAATNAAMTDGLQTGDQTGTNAGNNGTPWIKMNLQNVYTIDRVVIGNASNSVPTGGWWSSAYTNDLDLQYSTDDTNWTTIVNTGDRSAYSFLYTISFAPVAAQYVRLVNSSPTESKYIAVTEFYALSPGQASP